MSIGEAIAAYTRLGQEIFEPTKAPWKEGRYKASNLAKAIQRIVGEAEARDQEARNGQPASSPKKGFMRKLVPKFLDTAAREQSTADKQNEALGKNVNLMDNRSDSCKTYVRPLLRTFTF